MGVVIKVGMADLKTGKAPDILTTLGLGSCIGIALWDPTTKIGGLAHVMLPDSTKIRNNSNIAKFADTGIAELVRQMEAMGVPRTIGMILQNALSQAELKQDKCIQLKEIGVGIKETRKVYFKQFQGAVQKKAIPGYYMDMWNSLLKRALEEKTKHPKRPASHFMIDPIRKKYLNTFCENFMVHCLEDT